VALVRQGRDDVHQPVDEFSVPFSPPQQDRVDDLVRVLLPQVGPDGLLDALTDRRVTVGSPAARLDDHLLPQFVQTAPPAAPPRSMTAPTPSSVSSSRSSGPTASSSPSLIDASQSASHPSSWTIMSFVSSSRLLTWSAPSWWFAAATTVLFLPRVRVLLLGRSLTRNTTRAQSRATRLPSISGPDALSRVARHALGHNREWTWTDHGIHSGHACHPTHTRGGT